VESGSLSLSLSLFAKAIYLRRRRNPLSFALSLLFSEYLPSSFPLLITARDDDPFFILKYGGYFLNRLLFAESVASKAKFTKIIQIISAQNPRSFTTSIFFYSKLKNEK